MENKDKNIVNHLQYQDKKVNKRYKNGVKYQQSMGFHEKWAENERFLAGDQWPAATERTKNLPRPVFNILRYIVTHKKSSVMGDTIQMLFKSEEFDIENPEVQLAQEGADKFTKYSSTLWEKIGQEQLNDEMLDSAASCGTGLLHYFWDNSTVGGISKIYRGEVQGEFLDPSNVFFGDTQMLDVQKQPWIVISSREQLCCVKKIAKANGVDDYNLENLNSDKDLTSEIYDGAKNEVEDDKKVTVLTQYEKKGGKVFYQKVCNGIIIQPETDSGLTLYPIALMNWLPRKKCSYGIGEIEGLITNQKSINFLYAMMMLSSQQTAWPKLLAKPGALRQVITNEPGEVIVDNYVGQGDGIKYLNTGNFNPMALTLVDKFIDVTRNFSGANDAATGQAPGADMAAQAIALLQKSSGVPLEDIKRRYYRTMEQVGRIWEDFWKHKYNLPRNIKVQDCFGNETMEEMQGDMYQEYPMELKIEIGPATTFSEFAAQNSLDKALEMGHIDYITYLKYSCKNTVPYKDRLIKELETKREQEALMMMQGMGVPPMDTPGPTGSMLNEEIVKEPLVELAGQRDVFEPNI